MNVINLVGSTSVKNPRTDTVHDAGPDGVFRDIPLDFAHELVTRHAAHWREETAHEAAQHTAALEQLRDPRVLPGVVADLRGRVESAEARLEALEAHIAAEAEIEDELAGDGESVVESNNPPVEKPAPAKKAAAKKTAAKPHHE